MNRSRSLPVLFMVSGVAATGVGLVTLGAAGHTPAISASCSGVVLQASSYDGSRQNVWSVTIDGSTTSGTFGESLAQTFPVPQDREFAWSGRIAGYDGSYEQLDSGALGPCVTPPTTAPPTTAPPTTAPPTTAPPTTAPPTTMPPTEPTPVEPTDSETTTAPPTTTPPTEPTSVEPTDSETTTAPTESPTTGVPPVVLGTSGTAGPAEPEDQSGDPSGDQSGDGAAAAPTTLPDTGAPTTSAYQVDGPTIPPAAARGILLGGVLLLLLGAWQLWRRESA